MVGQRRVAGAAQKFFDVGYGWKVAEQGFLFDEDRQCGAAGGRDVQF